MMKRSNDIMKEVVGREVKKVAGELNVSPELIYSWQKSYKSNPIERVIKIFEETQDQRMIEYICNRAGGFFVENTENLDTEATINKIHLEISDVTRALATAWADKKLTLNELVKIQCEFNDLQSALTGFLSKEFEKYTIEND